jgi:predicted TIM-barrel fold metal-dependent hydrolase
VNTGISFLLCLISIPLALSACSGPKGAVEKRISDAVAAIRLIDTHEHLGPEADRLEREMSLFTHLHYVLSDMWADGLDREQADKVLNDPNVSLEKKWETIAPYWENVKTTAYVKSLRIWARDLYGIDDVSESTYMELSEKIKEANKPGIYRDILKDKAGIDLSIADGGQWPAEGARRLDREIFRAVVRLDLFLLQWDSFDEVEAAAGFKIRNLSDWERALELAFSQAVEWGFVGIKCGLAYNRTLDFEKVGRGEAQKILARMIRDRGKGKHPDWRDIKPLQDHMFHLIAESCARHDIPLQIHTGLFYDTWRDIRQANPANLIPFIMEHRDTRFLLMHVGYPYAGELLAMAKNLPNVVVDMCWGHIISPAYCVRFLDEAIETVPSDKLLAFGGDYSMPEGAYGHAVLCREVITKVLADKVIDGYWSEAEALEYAQKIMRDNPIKAFKLDL